MNRKVGIFLIISLIIGSLVGYKYSSGYDIQKVSDHGEVNLKGKDIKGAVDFVFDNKENIIKGATEAAPEKECTLLLKGCEFLKLKKFTLRRTYYGF